MRSRKILFILSVLLFNTSFAQVYDKKFSVSANTVYTTSSKLYLAPNSSDRFIRNTFISYDDLLSHGIDFRYRLNKELILSLNIERLSESKEGRNVTVLLLENFNTETIAVKDGFEFYPMEFTLYYIFPFSTVSFKFLMGGGIGYYFGIHLREFGDAVVKNVKRNFAYGFHVSTSFEYFLNESFSLRGEMKFRDPQFTLESSYEKGTVKYGNRDVVLLQDTFDSKINIDGVSFGLGLAFHF